MGELDSSRQPTRLSPQGPAAGEQADWEGMAGTLRHIPPPHFSHKHTSTCTQVAVTHAHKHTHTCTLLHISDQLTNTP